MTPTDLSTHDSKLPDEAAFKILAQSRAGQVSLIGLLATLLAWGSWFVGGTSLTSFEWSAYDSWLRLRQPIAVSPLVVVIARDQASEARFGTGPWDHALFARAMTALGRAGAAVVSLDVPIEYPSPPGRGGAASDAMLIEATKSVGRVVYPFSVRLNGNVRSEEPMPTGHELEMVHPTWPTVNEDQARRLPQVVATTGLLTKLARHAKGIGHTLIIADDDGVVRRVPLYATLGDRAVPAFGLAIAAAYLQVAPEQISINPGQAVTLHDARFPDGPFGPVSIPIDKKGQVLVNYAGRWAEHHFLSLSFLDIWSAIEGGNPEKLREWVGGKIVLLLPTLGGKEQRTPLEQSAADRFIQANLLNALLTNNWVKEAPLSGQVIYALSLAAVAAWLLLSVNGWKGMAGVIALTFGHIGLVLAALPLGGLVLPAFTPLCAIALASSGAILWMHLASGQRIQGLEANIERVQQELTTARDALVHQESNVEGLEEDLEVAQELIRSTKAMREQLAEAQSKEQATRQRLQELESELSGLRAATIRADHPGDTEQGRLSTECEQMGIITRDPSVLAVFRDLKKGARSPLSVLILGEPGTGKELFARAAHQLSPRANYPFIPVNMAAIAPELFETELFGHLKGSFTGTTGDRKGYFELAHQGTIFLDEIGDLRLEHQGKLLRVLQEKSFYRVGATRPTTVDVRVVTATNKDLQRGVSEGWFREDLYFRLKGLVVRLPPLRERGQDLALLAERFVRDAAAQIGRNGLVLSQEALAVLEAQVWKGNIRELQQCLEQAVALTEGNVITKDDLRLVPREQPGPYIQQTATARAIETTGDMAVLTCLRQHGFDMLATARAVGWDRSTVTQRLKGMGFRALVESRGDRQKAALALAGDPALARTVELKLLDYYDHLIKTIQVYSSAEEAIAASKKRFKNLPDRHFRSVEALVRQHFDRSGSSHPS
ncbi:MAG TPA: sigma 54-interacting transcriptional regulator [Nitrospiraceae bacterium]|nr:sigma 54-interacting transcriptional regulator [Nitrospiraceae bacterium]